MGIPITHLYHSFLLIWNKILVKMSSVLSTKRSVKTHGLNCTILNQIYIHNTTYEINCLITPAYIENFFISHQLVRSIQPLYLYIYTVYRVNIAAV